MKRFIFSVLCVSIFFVGLGYLVEKVGARFKSDEKALSLIKAARTAIGGDNSIAGVQSVRIKGVTTNIFKTDGSEKAEPGETTIAIQFPDKLSKTIKIGNGDESDAKARIVNDRVDTVIVRRNPDGTETVGKRDGVKLGDETEPGVKVIAIKKRDGSPDDAKGDEQRVIVLDDKKVEAGTGEMRRFRVDSEKMEAAHAAIKQNELFRLSLGLLLSPPAGMDVNYTFAGESDVDGTACNIVVADMGGRSVKLFLNKSSNLPVMMAYDSEPIIRLRFNTKAPAPPDGGDKNVVFITRSDTDPQLVPFQVKFSDYRSVNGVMLPFHWTTTGGDSKEDFDVTSFEVNPADIASSFENQKREMHWVTKDGQ